MVGMLQVFTYMFAFYLVVKGVEIYLMTKPRPGEDRKNDGTGMLILILCVLAAGGFIFMQEAQVRDLVRDDPYSLSGMN